MFRISTAIAVGVTSLTLFVPLANSQQSAPLGDVAREQREMHKQQPRAAKKYSNVDVVTGAASASDDDGASPISAIAEESPVPERSKKVTPEKTSAATSRSVMDRDADPADAVFIVPAGTQLRVDISESKVIVPVRVGFSTPIPALSKVAVRMVQQAYDPYNEQTVNTAELTSVTIEGTTYAVETDLAPVIFVEETTFTLAKPLAIKR